MHITVLGTTRERKSIRWKIGWVDGTEVSMHLHELFTENHVVHLHFKATSCWISGCHVSCVLTTSHNTVESLMFITVVKRRNRCRSTWLTVVVLFDNLKIVGVDQLGVTISATSQKHRVVVGHLESKNFTSVWLSLMNELFAHQMILQQLAVVCWNNNSLVLWAPNCFCEYVIILCLDFVFVFWCVAG